MAFSGAFGRSAASKLSIKCSRFTRKVLLEGSKYSLRAARTLLSDAHLGLGRYKRSRRQVSNHLRGYKESYCTKLAEQLHCNTPGILQVVNPTNLAVLLHAAETDQDISIVRDFITRFHLKNQEEKSCTFVFGPVVMRLLHTQNRVDAAYELFLDKGLQGFFSNVTNHIILMDMLFESGEYSKCITVLDYLTQNRPPGHILPLSCLTIGFAACLQLNSKQSYKKMQSLFMLCTSTNIRLPMRLVQLSTLLCIKQRKAAQGMVLLSLSGRLSQDTDIKVLLNIKLGQLSRALSILDRFLVQHNSPKVCQNIINELKEASKCSIDDKDKELLPLIRNVETGLQSKGQIIEDSLEKFVLRPINLKPLLPDGFIERLLSSAFEREPEEIQYKVGITL